MASSGLKSVARGDRVRHAGPKTARARFVYQRTPFRIERVGDTCFVVWRDTDARMWPGKKWGVAADLPAALDMVERSRGQVTWGDVTGANAGGPGFSTRHGERVELVRAASRETGVALVRRLRDGLEFELHFSEAVLRGNGARAFYGLSA